MNILEKYLKDKPETFYVLLDGKVIVNPLLVLLSGEDKEHLVMVKNTSGKLKFLKGNVEIRNVETE